MKITILDHGDGSVGLHPNEWVIELPDEDWQLIEEENQQKDFKKSVQEFFESWAVVNGRVSVYAGEEAWV